MVVNRPMAYSDSTRNGWLTIHLAPVWPTIAKRNVSEWRVVQQPDRFENVDLKKGGLSGKGELNGSGSIGGGRVIFRGNFGSLEEDSAGDDPFLEKQKMLSMEGDRNWNATRDNWTFKRNFVMLLARGKDTPQYGPFNC